MEQSTFPISRNLSLERLVAAALGEIERLGYSRRSRNRYRAIWEHLIEFSGRKRLGDQFSGELAVRFLEEYRVTGDEIDMSGQGWRKHMVWGVSALADFAENGRIERALQSGISLDMIRDFLGHVDVKTTTQIYARANLEMKRNALETITDPSPVRTIPAWQKNKDLLDWLRSL